MGELVNQKKSSGRGGLRPNSGRPKGAKDGGRQLVRDMIAKTLEHLGGDAYFAEVARTHPPAFLQLVGRLMPIQVVGQDDGAITVTVTHKVVRA